MKLAIASGKGGTGKTTLAVALAQAAQGSVHLLDCDVEEPNGHIFVNPQLSAHTYVTVAVPVLDESKCTNCGKCGEICEFSAIITIVDQTLVFADMCHSCGGCILVCPHQALVEQPKTIGHVDIGHCATGDNLGEITLVQGELIVGEALAPPIIRQVKKMAATDHLNIVDCPPGTSCPMITAVSGCDFVLLVTEPTPFGLHDLKLAVETVRYLHLPFGVVVNRATSGNNCVADYCATEQIPLMLEIADDRRVASAYSRGEGLLSALPELAEPLRTLLANIDNQVHQIRGGQK